MDNPEKTKGAIKNRQSRDNDNIGYTRHGTIMNGQSRDTGNIGYTRHRTKTNKTKNITQKTKKMNNTYPTKNRG